MKSILNTYCRHLIKKTFLISSPGLPDQSLAFMTTSTRFAFPVAVGKIISCFPCLQLIKKAETNRSVSMRFIVVFSLIIDCQKLFQITFFEDKCTDVAQL